MINNAGLIRAINNKPYNKILLNSIGDIDTVMQTNHLGPMTLTLLLLELFNKNEARIINLTSNLYELSNIKACINSNNNNTNNISNLFLESTGSSKLITKYSNSNLAIIYFNSYLSNVLQKNYPYIKTISINPGNVDTDLKNQISQSFVWMFRPLLKLLFNCAIKYISKTPNMGAQPILAKCYVGIDDIVNGGYYEEFELKDLGIIDEKTDNTLYRDSLLDQSWKVIDEEMKDIFQINKPKLD